MPLENIVIHPSVLLIFFLVSISEPSFAACLPNADIANSCRYALGDTWCTEHGKGNRFAFHDGCLKDVRSFLSSNDASLPKDERWLVIASRPTIEEARAFAESYQSEFIDPAIIYATNGWYAVTIGNGTHSRMANILAELIASGKIPKDSFLAKYQDLYLHSFVKVQLRKFNITVTNDSDNNLACWTFENEKWDMYLSLNKKERREYKNVLEDKLIGCNIQLDSRRTTILTWFNLSSPGDYKFQLEQVPCKKCTDSQTAWATVVIYPNGQSTYPVFPD